MDKDKMSVINKLQTLPRELIIDEKTYSIFLDSPGENLWRIGYKLEGWEGIEDIIPHYILEEDDMLLKDLGFKYDLDRCGCIDKDISVIVDRLSCWLSSRI